MPDLERMAQDVIEATKGFVARAVAPLKAQVDALALSINLTLERHERLITAPKEFDYTPVFDRVEKRFGELAASIRVPEDGEDAVVDYTLIETTVKEMVAEAVAALPAPEKGKDADQVDLTAVAALVPKPKDGADPDYARIGEMVKSAVADAVAAIPKPKDGESVDQTALREWINTQIGLEVARLPRPKDGESVHPDTVQLMVSRETERILSGWPRPKDGNDGDDGLGFDDLSVDYDGRRSFTIKFQRGEESKEFGFTLPVILDAGVFRRGNDYEKGDSVTWDGSMWIAQRDTADKPGESDAWRLSAKRGRDGKDFSPAKTEAPQVVRLR